MDRFDLRTAILLGKPAFYKVIENAKRVFIVTDNFLVKNGAVRYVTDFLDSNHATYEIFDNVKPDPDIETITAGNEAMIKFSPDTVVALGGGSPIDAAKAMVYFAQRQFGLKDCPFIAIPTTSGTGSEVSKFAVITDKDKGIKYPLVDVSLLPDYAVLDAELTKTVPPSVTADTGLDVLTHAIEAYTCTESNSFTDAMAEKAIKLVYENLTDCCHHPDNLEARQAMHNASCLAGAAFSNAGLGLCHSMAHALGAKFHIPHGRANAILLPIVMTFNAGCETKLTHTATQYAKLASQLDLKASNRRQSAINLIRTVRSLCRETGIPKSIRDAGVPQEAFSAQLDGMSDAALADKCITTTPLKPSKDDIIMLYREAYAGNSHMLHFNERRDDCGRI